MNEFRIRRALTTVVLSLGALTLGGCFGDDDPVAPAITDGDLVAVARALSNAEIATSEPAATRTENEAVVEFAQLMITQHTAANAAIDSLGIAPRGNNLSLQLAQITAGVVSDLQLVAGAEFDSLYVSTQIDLHTTALDLIDNVLIPEVEDPDLLGHLQEMRVDVAAELEAANDLEETLAPPAT